ncbi:unnamed protein product, partial [marine sediment metagenome]
MTSKRMISTSLPDSEKIMDCSSDTVRLLFVWLCLSVDDDGRMQAKPRTIKKRFFGDRDNIKLKDCDKFLKELSDVGLIYYYTDKVSSGVISVSSLEVMTAYIEIPKWSCINKVRADMYKKSEIPPFSSDLHTTIHPSNVVVTDSVHRLDKVRLDKSSIDKVSSLSGKPDIPYEEIIKDLNLKA